MDEDSVMEMEMAQIKGVDSTDRMTVAELKKGARLVVRERLMTHGNQDAVSGYRVTSKVEGYTDKSIFLPAAGCRYAVGVDNEGEAGYYWSSTHFDAERAYCMKISADEMDADNRAFRSSGCSVRLVMDN